LPLGMDAAISSQMPIASRLRPAETFEDGEVVGESDRGQTKGIERIEQVRGRLLAMTPKNFEFFVKDLLLHCPFTDVCVTRFSADGGGDVNAKPGGRFWMFVNTHRCCSLSDGCTPPDEKKLLNCAGVCSPLPV